MQVEKNSEDQFGLKHTQYSYRDKILIVYYGPLRTGRNVGIRTQSTLSRLSTA